MAFSQRAVEAAADAIDEAIRKWQPGSPDRLKHMAAKAALTAALAVDGVALVPREPSDDTLKAGYEAMLDDKYDGTQAPMMYAVWAVMIAAASEGEERK